MAAASALPPELILQVADFAEFLSKKRGKETDEKPAEDEPDMPLAEEESADDDEVDLGGSGRGDESGVMDLSGILSNGPHSSIGLV